MDTEIRIMLAGFVGVLGLIFVSCGSSPGPGAAVDRADRTAVAPVPAVASGQSYAHTYADIGELTAFSDLVVHVRVRGVGQQVDEPEPEGRPPSVRLLAMAEVIDVAKGPVAPGDLVGVRGVGGEIDGLTVSGGDAPVLEAGAEYVLFLTRDAQEPETYWVQGASLGRLDVRDGKVYSLSARGGGWADLPDLAIDGQPLADVLAEARSHATDPRPQFGR